MFANKLFYIRPTIARRSNRRTRIGIIIAKMFAWIDKGAKAQTRVASFPHVVRTTACARSLFQLSTNYSISIPPERGRTILFVVILAEDTVIQQ